MNYAIFFTEVLNIEYSKSKLYLLEVVHETQLESRLKELQVSPEKTFPVRMYLAMPTVFPVSSHKELSKHREDYSD